MSLATNPLLPLYLTLTGWVIVGGFLGRVLPIVAIKYLGQFLFWVGVPLSIVAFLRQATLSGLVWLAPLAAWSAIFLGLGLGWWWMGGRWSKTTQGSFLLAAMVGNTGYLGYPIALSLVGSQYFAWALFYDLLGTTIGAYGLGVALAAHFGAAGNPQGQRQGWLLQAMVRNPALWSVPLGILSRRLSLPPLADRGLEAIGWAIVALSLVLMGMQLSQLASFRKIRPALMGLGIKMLLVPLLLGLALTLFQVQGPPRLILVLQAAMPPAFATLVIAETYELDQELTVTCLAIGYVALLFTLPVWLWLFHP